MAQIKGKRLSKNNLTIFCVAALLFSALGVSLAYAAGFSTAEVVYGQGGIFTTNDINKGGISADSLYSPTGVALDVSGNLYVADYSNNRVLYYPAGSTTATRVYGQGGSFTTNNPNKGGISANSLRSPTGVALDGSGNLYVVDWMNSRVLYYPAGSTTATRVYGQGGSFTTAIPNKGGIISADSLYYPTDVALDGSGNLYVADNNNNRVLYYPAGSTTATRVYGQGGSFTTNIANKGGLSADSLYWPNGVALDGSGNLYVTEYTNNRVLYYPAGSATATRVYGQGGSFTTNTSNKGGISADSLSYPYGVALDDSGNLYVADLLNSRVLYYPAGSATATRVYGQVGSFTTDNVNKGGISADSLYSPDGVALDGGGNLYVADASNNRVLKYVAPSGGTISGTVYANSVAPANVLAGAFVQVCAGGACHVTSTNASGQYSVIGLPDGSYTAVAFPPGGSTLVPNTIGPLTITGGATLADQNIVLHGPTAFPAGTTIIPSTTGGGLPRVYSLDPLVLTTHGCTGGTANYEITQYTTVIRSGTMAEGPAGTYTANVAAFWPFHGNAHVEITLVCSGVPTVIAGDIYIDPSGVVKTTGGDLLPGATVTLFRSDAASGPFTQVDNGSGIMSPANRNNPDTTDAAGHFGWDVIAGYYKVRAAKAGCVSPFNFAQAFVETNVMQIPPPVTNLELVLNCSGVPMNLIYLPLIAR